MKEAINYRSFVIAKEDDWYIAKSLDGEPAEICSRHLLRLMRAIDALWISLDSGTAPQWFTDDDLIDLDEPVCDRMRLLRPLALSSYKAAESVPSEVDPPKRATNVFLMVAAAVGIAVPVAIGLHQIVSTSEPAIIFTLAVMAIALTYGAVPAILASLVSMVVYNFAFIEPILHLTVPGAEELSYTLINVAISFGLPWIFGLRKWTIRREAESDHTQGTALPYP